MLLSWNLTTPFMGVGTDVEDEGYSLFLTAPSSNFLVAKLQAVDRISDLDALTLMELPLSQFRVVEGISGKGVVYDKGTRCLTIKSRRFSSTTMLSLVQKPLHSRHTTVYCPVSKK